MEYTIKCPRCGRTELTPDINGFDCDYCGNNFEMDEVEEFEIDNKIQFPILDISEISLATEVDKLTEETHEFINAISNNDIENTIEEAFDIFQVVINILDKCDITTENLEEGLEKHTEKIIGRGWKIKKYI